MSGLLVEVFLLAALVCDDRRADTMLVAWIPAVYQVEPSAALGR
jgi:hypothetical protein